MKCDALVPMTKFACFMALRLSDHLPQDPGSLGVPLTSKCLRRTHYYGQRRGNEERARIAERVSERRILRLSVGVDPLEEANSIIQDLAHDIETNWSDYEDEE